MLIPYGVDRLPRDVTLRSVAVGTDPLRLNSKPVPPDVMPVVAGDHAARVAAAIAWLHDLCGDYAPLRRQFIDAYFRWAAAHIDVHRDALTERLRRFDGLFVPEDFLWSAPRPLPRGWAPAGERYLLADIVFWLGASCVAIEVAARETERQRALASAGVAVWRVMPTEPERIGEIFSPFQRFWEGQALPSSPFRRPLLGLPTPLSSQEA